MKNIATASTLALVVIFISTFTIVAIGSIINDSNYAGLFISLGMAGAASILALIVMAIWVIPAHLILKHFGRTQVTWYVFTVLVPTFSVVYGFKPFRRDSAIDLLMQASFCGFVGTLGVITFWYILVYRNRINRVSN